MKLRLEAATATWPVNEPIAVRLLVINSDYEPRVLDRRLLIGPNLERAQRGRPSPVNVEPAFDHEEQNLVTLNPGCLYGRERTFAFTEPGLVTFHAFLLKEPTEELLAPGPSDPEFLLLAAPPLRLRVEPGAD